MFDPDVLDPLVKEHGIDKFGLIIRFVIRFFMNFNIPLLYSEWIYLPELLYMKILQCMSMKLLHGK
jgi:hypothetical protein